MIDKIIFLATYVTENTPGSSISTFLQNAGFYSFILPFLLIFSLVYGILTRMDLFKDNKGVSAIISLSVGLLALQFNIVSNFFSEVFPKVGIGLSLILGLLILIGAFIDRSKQWILYVLLAVGALITFFVLYPSFQNAFGFGGSSTSSYDTGVIVGWAMIILVVVVGLAAVLGWNPFRKGAGQQQAAPANAQMPYQPYLFFPVSNQGQNNQTGRNP